MKIPQTTPPFSPEDQESRQKAVLTKKSIESGHGIFFLVLCTLVLLQISMYYCITKSRFGASIIFKQKGPYKQNAGVLPCYQRSSVLGEADERPAAWIINHSFLWGPYLACLDMKWTRIFLFQESQCELSKSCRNAVDFTWIFHIYIYISPDSARTLFIKATCSARHLSYTKNSLYH